MLTAQQLIASPRVLIIAHRGNSRYAPENTLSAFRSALSTGADFVELDYRHSADGVPIVIHDSTLDRTTNARQVFGNEEIDVSSKTLSELALLDAGIQFPMGFADEPLPTLEQALDVIQPHSMTMIERKAGDAATLIRLLESKAVIDRVIVQAFDWAFLTECRRLAPALALGALGKEDLTSDMIEDATHFRPQVIGWRNTDIGKAAIDLIHRAGMKAWTYTVDEPAEANRLIDAGIDGLISNDPARVAVAMGEVL